MTSFSIAVSIGSTSMWADAPSSSKSSGHSRGTFRRKTLQNHSVYICLSTNPLSLELYDALIGPSISYPRLAGRPLLDTIRGGKQHNRGQTHAGIIDWVRVFVTSRDDYVSRSLDEHPPRPPRRLVSSCQGTQSVAHCRGPRCRHTPCPEPPLPLDSWPFSQPCRSAFQVVNIGYNRRPTYSPKQGSKIILYDRRIYFLNASQAHLPTALI